MTKRRDFLRQALVIGGATTAALSTVGSADAQEAAGTTEAAADAATIFERDRAAVMKAGLNAAEADCWELVAKSAGAFFKLEEIHPMDRQEVASAIHIIQNKLLSRPTYRKYLEASKAGR